jgi:hypothetical protein
MLIRQRTMSSPNIKRPSIVVKKKKKKVIKRRRTI